MPKPIKRRVSKKKRPDEEEVKGKALETLNLLRQKKKVLIYSLSAIGFIIIVALILIIYSSSIKKEAYSFEIESYKPQEYPD